MWSQKKENALSQLRGQRVTEGSLQDGHAGVGLESHTLGKNLITPFLGPSGKPKEQVTGQIHSVDQAELAVRLVYWK